MQTHFLSQMNEYKKANSFLAELFWRWSVETVWSRGRIASRAASASRGGAGTSEGARPLLHCWLLRQPLLISVEVVRGSVRLASLQQRGDVGGTKAGGRARRARRRSVPRTRVVGGSASGAGRHPIARREAEA